MTQLVKNVIFSSIMSLAFITSAVGEKCERLEMYELNISSTNIEADLTTGIWQTNLMDAESTMYFQEDGLVEIIRKVDSGDEIKTEAWDVQMKDSHSVLTLMSETGIVQSVKLYPTCDGFALRASNGSAGIMKKIKRENRALIERARSQMEGVWEAIAKKMPDRNKSLIWEFKHDGTFTLNIGPDLYHNGYQGIWDIAADGEHVVLYFTRPESEETVYAEEMIKIHNVDYEDLVLSGKTFAKLTGHKNSASKVYFQKDFQ